MNTANFNLRGIPLEVMALLRSKAKEEHISMNILMLKLIEQGIGFKKASRQRYHELDHLAGAWTEKECNAFMDRIKCFEQIDGELWG